MTKYIKSLMLLALPTIIIAHEGTVLGPDQDGIYTYTQIVDSTSEPEYFTRVGNTGFDYKGQKFDDFGWTHTFPEYLNPDITILDAKLLITAYDVDVKPSGGATGEYNQISIDNSVLNPGFLQGSNDKTFTTKFDITLSKIIDDGKMNVFLDIDIKERKWRVTIPQSTIKINYKVIPNNLPPYKANLISKLLIPQEKTPLTIDIDGGINDSIITTQLDPNDDMVTYKYRWFVKIGNGEYMDSEFAGKGNITSNTVPADKIKLNEKWRVEVTTIDIHGAISDTSAYTWQKVTVKDSDLDGVPNAYDNYPDDYDRAFDFFYPAKNSFNTLLYEDMWPHRGDYDMNDLVLNFNYKFIKFYF